MQELREKHGLTQQELASFLDLRRESLSRIESGKVALTLPILQRFTRIITLARAVREHLAWAESRGNLPDQHHLDTLAVALHLDKAAADEVVLAATIAYDRKKREALRSLPSSAVPRRVTL